MTWWRVCLSWKQLPLWFPWLWCSHATVCEVGLACARQHYGSRSWSDAKWASFTPSASSARLCRGGTVAVEREDPDPGVVWHFDPAETVSSHLNLSLFFFSRAARYRDMWQWEALRGWRRRRQNYLQRPAEVKGWWWSGVAERPWTTTEYTQTQTSTACSSPSWRRRTQTPANDRWKLRRRRPAVPSAPTLEVRQKSRSACGWSRGGGNGSRTPSPVNASMLMEAGPASQHVHAWSRSFTGAQVVLWAPHLGERSEVFQPCRIDEVWLLQTQSFPCGGQAEAFANWLQQRKERVEVLACTFPSPKFRKSCKSY